MKEQYKPIKSMKEVPDQVRKLRREYIRYQQAELIYSLSHKKLLELASDAGAIFRIRSLTASPMFKGITSLPKK